MAAVPAIGNPIIHFVNSYTVPESLLEKLSVFFIYVNELKRDPGPGSEALGHGSKDLDQGPRIQGRESRALYFFFDLCNQDFQFQKLR